MSPLFVKVDTRFGELSVSRGADDDFFIEVRADGVEQGISISRVAFRRLLSAFPELYSGLPQEVATEDNGLLPARRP